METRETQVHGSIPRHVNEYKKVLICVVKNQIIKTGEKISDKRIIIVKLAFSDENSDYSTYSRLESI